MCLLLAADLVETWIAQINNPAESRPFPGGHGNPITEDPFGYLYEHEHITDTTDTIYNGIDGNTNNVHSSVLDSPASHVHNDHYDMTRFDWCDGDVRVNVKHVLTGLLQTEVSLSNNIPLVNTNPIVTMETRHKRVKERRVLKDHAHKVALMDQRRKIEIHQRAKEMIKIEEEERMKRERCEEE